MRPSATKCWRCAKYNGTFERVFTRYRQRQLWARNSECSRVDLSCETPAFDDHGVGVMQQPVQNGGGQGAVMVKDCEPPRTPRRMRAVVKAV